MSETVLSQGDIHSAILKVYDKVGYVRKDGRIESGTIRYSFAKEADFIAALRPEMIAADIYQSPESMVIVSNDRIETKRLGNQGQEFTSYQFRVVVQVGYRFTHAPSGTSILVPAFGEGMDSGDKAFNKAMTGANKYALRQTFMIETGDDPDRTASHPDGGVDDPSAMRNNNAKSNQGQAKPTQQAKPETKTETKPATSKMEKLSPKVIQEVADGIPKLTLAELSVVENKVNGHGVAQRIEKAVWGDLAYAVIVRLIELSPADPKSLAAIGNKLPPLAAMGVMTSEQRAELIKKMEEKIGEK